MLNNGDELYTKKVVIDAKNNNKTSNKYDNNTKG